MFFEWKIPFLFEFYRFVNFGEHLRTCHIVNNFQLKQSRTSLLSQQKISMPAASNDFSAKTSQSINTYIDDSSSTHISVDNVRVKTGTVIVECIFCTFSFHHCRWASIVVVLFSFSRSLSLRYCFLSCGIFCIFAHRFTNNLSNMNPLNIHVMWTYANDVVVRNAKLGAALFVYHTLTEQESF